MREWTDGEQLERQLMDQLVNAEAAGTLPGKLVELSRLNLLILDELGYLALDRCIFRAKLNADSTGN